MLVSVEPLERLAAAVYEAAGAPPQAARIVAAHQVGADLAGHQSHGVMLLPTYVKRIDRGHIDPKAEPTVIAETAATLAVDGHWGFGPVVSEWTMDRTIEKARASGAAVATVREQSHVGRLADYPLRAVRAGFIAMMMCDSGQGVKTVAPFGGREARLGTNPLAIAFPSDLEAPPYVDMATSAVAKGKIKAAIARNQPLPEGWLLDTEGRPTTDPTLVETGVMLPLGGAEAHKGYALSFAVEVLAALLPGLGFGIDPQGRHNDGAFMLVIDPAAFGRPASEFRAMVGDFARYLKATPPAQGFEAVLYPGEYEWRAAEQRRSEGIPVPDKSWTQVAEIAERFGLHEQLQAAETSRAAQGSARA